MARTKTIKKITKKTIMCVKCGMITDSYEKQFPKTNSSLYAGYEGYLPICKTCLNKLYSEYLDIYQDHFIVLRRICQLFDIYYNESLAKSLMNSDMRTIPTRYISKLNLNPHIGKTYHDTILEEEKAKKVQEITEQSLRQQENREDAEINTEEIDETVEKQLADARKIFGSITNENDALFLKNEYDDWKFRTGAKSKAEEEIIKNICYNSLSLKKARESGSSTKAIEETLLNNIKAGGWQPKTEENGDEMSVGQWIQTIEMERPISEVQDRYKDVDNLKKMIDVFYLGHLGKATGIRNIYIPEYEETMKKYSVIKNESGEDEQDDVIIRLFGD